MIKSIVKKIVLFIYSIYNKIYFHCWIKKHRQDIVKNNRLISNIEEDRVLILAPHVDDDIIGCGGCIIQLINQNKDLWITYLTDGGKRGVAGNSYNDIVLERQKEAKNVAKYLGVPLENLKFLNGVDGDLEESNILNELEQNVEDIKPNAIFLPIFMDTHRDHVATYYKLLEVVKKSEDLFSNCNFYFYESQSPITQLYSNTTLDISNEYNKKKKTLSFYKSQNNDFKFVEFLNELALISFRKKGFGEVFLKVNLEEFKNISQLIKNTNFEEVIKSLVPISDSRSFKKSYISSVKNKDLLMLIEIIKK